MATAGYCSMQAAGTFSFAGEPIDPNKSPMASYE